MPAHRQPLLDRQDIPAGLGLLTRLPVRVNASRALARGAAASWAWPLAGLVVAGIGGLSGAAVLAVDLPPGIAAGLTLAVQVAVTGGLHEDGLADCADGFWGGWDRKRRLEIMKDSHIGSYGVLALVFVIGLTWQALAALMVAPDWPLWLVAAAMLSRAAMAGVMAGLPRARPGGLSARVGRPSYRSAGLAALIASAAALVLLGLHGLAAIAAAALAALAMARLARAKIRGQTGDVLGAVQMLSALVVLTVGAALA